jgi:predicted choloylglycine hydrolase
LRPVITEAVRRWKANLENLIGINGEQYVQRFVEGTNLRSAVERWTPDLLEEIRGIGEGAGIDFDTIFAWQCPDEEWWYRVFEKKLGADAVFGRHCSALGCFKEDQTPALLAQNMDMPNEYDGLQVLLNIRDSATSLQSYIFTYAGGIGSCGMNDRPVGICANTLLDLKHAAGNLPVALIIRKVLECSTLEEAIEFIHRIKHASGQNYMIGDNKRVLDFECSANKVLQFVPYPGARVVYHTNHAIVNDDKVSSAEEILQDAESSVHTQARFAFLEKNLRGESKSMSVASIQSILNSHAVPTCFHNTHTPGGMCTAASLVMSMSNPPKLYVTMQPPCSREPTGFSF